MSLAWRDSGTLLATLGLVAEGMGLECCGLGLHDIPALRRFLKLNQFLSSAWADASLVADLLTKNRHCCRAMKLLSRLQLIAYVGQSSYLSILLYINSIDCPFVFGKHSIFFRPHSDLFYGKPFQRGA